jgi:DNA-binding NarL/FixJ family response regulator
MIRLFVIEDHPVIVSGLRNMFRPHRDQIEISVTVTDLGQALRYEKRENFDLILLDLWLPDGDPEENIKALITRFPGKPVAVYTSEQSFQWQRKMFKAGAAAYLVKTADKSTIKSTLERVFAGETVFSYSIEQYQAKKSILESGNQHAGLTQDQQKLINLLSEGQSLKQIADKQGKSVSAIEKMLKQLRNKYEAKSNVELIKILLFSRAD